MKLKPISWYFHFPTAELLVGPSGHNNHAAGWYELESANEHADKFHMVHNPGIDLPNRYFMGKHHAEQIRDKYKLPLNGWNLEIPNVAIIPMGAE